MPLPLLALLGLGGVGAGVEAFEGSRARSKAAAEQQRRKGVVDDLSQIGGSFQSPQHGMLAQNTALNPDLTGAQFNTGIRSLLATPQKPGTQLVRRRNQETGELDYVLMNTDSGEIINETGVLANDPSTNVDVDVNNIPASTVTGSLVPAIESMEMAQSLNDEFIDSFGGMGFGLKGFGNRETADRQLIADSISGANPERNAYWQRYKVWENLMRHELFGGALTAEEIAQWNAAAAHPSQDPKVIRNNLKLQQALAKKGLKVLEGQLSRFNFNIDTNAKDDSVQNEWEEL